MWAQLIEPDGTIRKELRKMRSRTQPERTANHVQEQTLPQTLRTERRHRPCSGYLRGEIATWTLMKLKESSWR